MAGSDATITHVHLLADVPNLIPAVGLMRWKEWARPPEPTHRDWWISATRGEAGRRGMPITLVTQDEAGNATGAVGLNTFDLPQFHDRSPWIIGMIIAPDSRGHGLGRVLIEGIEKIAIGQGHQQLWVATELAAGFYQRCGYRLTETTKIGADLKHILVKDLTRPTSVREPLSTRA
jgi:GNAT superfamily N-acetyltransferase